MYGVDYSRGRPTMAGLKTAGVKYVCRYLVPTVEPFTFKALTGAEAKQILGAGLELVVVWETSGTEAQLGKPAGIADALAADALAKAYGLAGIPIYFALDWDAAPWQQTAINAYCDGIISVIGLARTGVYGGYWPLSRIRAAGKARYYWGTFGWSGNNWQTAGWPPSIMQRLSMRVIDGVECDEDDSNFEDFGQWPRPKPPVPATAYRQEMNGDESIEDYAKSRGADPIGILDRSAKDWTPADKAKITELVLPTGFPVYTAFK